MTDVSTIYSAGTVSPGEVINLPYEVRDQDWVIVVADGSVVSASLYTWTGAQQITAGASFPTNTAVRVIRVTDVQDTTGLSQPTSGYYDAAAANRMVVRTFDALQDHRDRLAEIPDADALESAQDYLEQAVAAVANVGSVYPTEADFVAASVPALHAYVRTAGYWAAGDGGGHLKRRISTPSPVYAWQKQSADGSWWEVLESIQDPKFYGAIDGGVGDYTAAVQAAFSFGTVVRISGSFGVTAQITRTIGSGFRHFGWGQSRSKLVWPSTATSYGVKVSTSTTAEGQFLEAKDYAILIDKAGVGVGLEHDYTSFAGTVNSIEKTGAISGMRVTGVQQVSDYWNIGIQVTNLKNVDITRNTVIGGGGTPVARGAAKGIYIKHAGGASMWHNNSNYMTGNVVTFCAVGIHIEDVEGNIIEGNDVQACNYALRIENLTQQKNQFRIMGNHLDGTHRSIQITSVSFGDIIGNEIFCLNTLDVGLTADQPLVDLKDVQGVHVLGNRIRNGGVANTRTGVKVTRVATLGNCADVVVDQNYMYDISTGVNAGANCVRIVHGDRNVKNLTAYVPIVHAMGTNENHRGVLGTGSVPSGQSPTLHIGNDDAAALSVGRLGSTGTAVVFSNDGTIVGSISVTGSATAYNTSSDRRLKEDIRDLEVDWGRFMGLKPRRFTMGGVERVGFVADEFMEVFPQSVEGEPMSAYPDDHPEWPGMPIYQRMQASSPESIAFLVRLVQDLQARLSVLEGGA